jgi:hypothetical protein
MQPLGNRQPLSMEEKESASRAPVSPDVDSVNIFPDELTAQIVGAPPILVTLEEVGLTQGCKPVVSEARPTQSPTGEFKNGLGPNPRN